jgi:hypothetical protein
MHPQLVSRLLRLLNNPVGSRALSLQAAFLLVRLLERKGILEKCFNLSSAEQVQPQRTACALFATFDPRRRWWSLRCTFYFFTVVFFL